MPPSPRDFRGHIGRRLSLRDLQAQFIRYEPGGWMEVDTLAESSGLRMLCPKCFTSNVGPIGTHIVVCWFRGRGVPDDVDPKPGRWTPSGAGLDDLTFVPGDPARSVSVLLTGGCGWHGFVRGGAVDSDV